MAFVCALTDDEPHCQLIGNHVVIQLGHDDETGGLYSLLIGFDTLGGGDQEYFFHVILVDRDDGEQVFWDGRRVRQFTTQSDRKRILTALILGTKYLVRAKSPERCLCCTFDPYLPDKAIVKYLLIFEAFKSCGYSVTECDPVIGKRSWWLERQPTDAVEMVAGADVPIAPIEN